MDELMLFIDGSVNTLSKTGYGASLVVTGRNWSPERLKAGVKVKKFEQTSSTKLELQTLLWALSDLKTFSGRVVVYTDSQNIVGLAGRRERLEKHNYYSKKNRRLNNYQLYQEFYRLTDEMDCEFVKLDGHKASKQKDGLDTLFTLVDRASRKALRKETNHLGRD